MTDRELQKLNRRELVELFRAQERSCEAAKKRLEELEQENQTLKESLTRIGKTMKEQREREEAADAALAEKTAVLAEKDAALQRLERELAEAGSGAGGQGQARGTGGSSFRALPADQAHLAGEGSTAAGVGGPHRGAGEDNPLAPGAPRRPRLKRAAAQESA